MPSSHLILGRPLLLLPPISPSIRVFSNESTLCMRCPKYWSFSFSIIPSKEIPGLVNPKGNQPWIFIGRTDAEVSILWPPDAKSQLIWKDADAGKDWKQEEKGMAEDEVVRWHHQLMDVHFSKLLELVKHKESWCAAVHGVTKSRTWLSDEVN